MLKQCSICHKDFEAKFNQQKYCSPECARAAENEKKRISRHKNRALKEGVSIKCVEDKLYGVRICARVGCNNHYIPRADNQKYCSPECAKIVKYASRKKVKNVNKKRMCKHDFTQKLKKDLKINENIDD